MANISCFFMIVNIGRLVKPLIKVLIPYGGKLWWWETLANFVNDCGFAKFIPAKFYPVKESLT